MRGFFVLMVAVLVAIGVGVGIAAANTGSFTEGSAPPPGSFLVHRGGPLGRITVAGGCPSSFSRYDGVDNSVVDFGSKLLPPDPDAARICRYDVTPSGDELPPVDRLLDKTQATNLASVTDLLSTKAVSGVFSCPAMFPEEVVIAFSYSGRPDIDLWYTDSGCQSVNNGTLGASISAGVTSFELFAALVGQLAPPAS